MIFPKSYLIIIAIAVCGFSYQVITITLRYLEYKTKTLISIENPLLISLPSLSTCWDIEDILDIDTLNKEKNINIPSWDELKANNSLYSIQMEKLTVTDYFKYTPANDSILQSFGGCGIRYPRNWHLKHPQPKADECYRLFTITKYIHRGMMCYLFRINIGDHGAYVVEYSLAPVYSGLIFRVFMNRTMFERVKYYSAFVHGNDTSKLYDSVFTSKRYLHPNITSVYLNLHLTYGSITTNYLTPPYDTQCAEYARSETMVDRWFAGIRNRIKHHLHHVDTFAPIYQDYDYPIIGRLSLINESFVKYLNNIVGSQPIELRACHSRYYVSTVSVSFSDFLVINVLWPEGYFTDISHVEEQMLIDFIVYVCSSIGIWFGLSFCSFNTFIRNVSRKPKALNPTNEKCGKCDLRFRAMFQYLNLVNRDTINRIKRCEQLNGLGI